MKEKDGEKEAAQQLITSLEALSLTELKRLQSDEEFMRLTTLCSKYHIEV